MTRLNLLSSSQANLGREIDSNQDLSGSTTSFVLGLSHKWDDPIRQELSTQRIHPLPRSGRRVTQRSIAICSESYYTQAIPSSYGSAPKARKRIFEDNEAQANNSQVLKRTGMLICLLVSAII